MGAGKSAGQRRAAKVRARRGRVRTPERVHGPQRPGRPDERLRLPEHQVPTLDPVEVLAEAEPFVPDEDLLRTALELAVVRTIDTGSPDVGDQVARRIEQLEAEYGEAVEQEYLDHVDGLMPWDPMLAGWQPAAWDVLDEWLRTAQQRPDPAALADRVLAWVGERLGRSGPGLEQQATLLGGPGARQPLDPGERLRDEIVAVQIWLVAGLVAVTRDVGPSARVDPAQGGHTATRAPTRRRGAVSSGDSTTARVSARTVGPER